SARRGSAEFTTGRRSGAAVSWAALLSLFPFDWNVTLDHREHGRTIAPKPELFPDFTAEHVPSLLAKAPHVFNLAHERRAKALVAERHRASVNSSCVTESSRRAECDAVATAPRHGDENVALAGQKRGKNAPDRTVTVFLCASSFVTAPGCVLVCRRVLVAEP